MGSRYLRQGTSPSVRVVKGPECYYSNLVRWGSLGRRRREVSQQPQEARGRGLAARGLAARGCPGDMVPNTHPVETLPRGQLTLAAPIHGLIVSGRANSSGKGGTGLGETHSLASGRRLDLRATTLARVPAPLDAPGSAPQGRTRASDAGYSQTKLVMEVASEWPHTLTAPCSLATQASQSDMLLFSGLF